MYTYIGYREQNGVYFVLDAFMKRRALRCYEYKRELTRPQGRRTTLKSAYKHASRLAPKQYKRKQTARMLSGLDLLNFGKPMYYTEDFKLYRVLDDSLIQQCHSKEEILLMFYHVHFLEDNTMVRLNEVNWNDSN